MKTDKRVVLVTGAAGFIGYHLSKKLLDQNNIVIGIDNLNPYYDVSLKNSRLELLTSNSSFFFYEKDLQDYNALKKIFEKHSIDIICNLAAQAGVRYSITDPFVYQKSNIEGFLNILELARKYKPRNFVYASSSSVYGKNKKIPFSVDDRVDNPVSLYAATKKANELIAHSYSHLYGIPCTGLRFFTVYGPWGRPDMALFLFTDAILNGRPIDVYNYGNMKRDFTYIDDIIDGTIKAINRPVAYDIFNLGNSRSENLLDFIDILEKELNLKAKKNMLPMQPGDVEETSADIDKSRILLGFSPKTPISEGIKNFVTWYKNYYRI